MTACSTKHASSGEIFGEAARSTGTTDGNHRKMIDEVYNKKILALALDIPPHRPARRPAQATASRHSRLCGPKITVDLVLDGDCVADYAHEVKACALGQSSASISPAWPAVGATIEEIRNCPGDQLRAAMLEGGRPGADRPLRRSRPARAGR